MPVVTDLCGLDGLPTSLLGLRKWLVRNEVPVQLQGKRFVFSLSDLPSEVRLAYVARECAAGGLPAGGYDDAAHMRLMAATPGQRDRAERRAAIARLLASAAARGVRPVDRYKLVQREFGNEGTSRASLKRIERMIDGVAPINYAPALLEDHAGGPAPAPMSDAAWQMFLKGIAQGGSDWPLKKAWCDVRDAAPAFGWAWPSFPTVWRRWQALSEMERRVARFGAAEAARQLAMPALRDKTGLGVLEWVSLDGRTLDFWVDFGDGRPVRPVMLALVDVASNLVLDYELSRTENGPATVRLIRRVCERFGIFDRLYTDNGSAFAGDLVAGGTVHRFRNSGSKVEGVRPLGICHHLGIDLHFALPTNAQAKIAERTFATLSRSIDDRPEFNGAHTGHAPGAAPDGKVAPVPLDLAQEVIRREIARHNAEGGRRGQGMAGRSYQAVFEAGLAGRVRRTATVRQLWLASLIYTPVMPDRHGRVRVDGWAYGGPDTQDALLVYHQRREKVLLGRNPDDFEAPALAWNAAGRLICDGIEPQRAGKYGSADGIREAARLRKRARVAAVKAEEATQAMSDVAYQAALAAIPTPAGPKVAGQTVVAGQFGGDLDRAPEDKRGARKVQSFLTPEMQRNYDRSVGLGS